MDKEQLHQQSILQFNLLSIKTDSFNYCLEKMVPTQNIDNNFEMKMLKCLKNSLNKRLVMNNRLKELKVFDLAYEPLKPVIIDDDESENF